MADFSVPFGENSGFRNPTNDEKVNGLPCGPADRDLFNGLFHRLEAEVGTVVNQAGLTPTNTSDDWLYQAIIALISAANGGNPAGYVLMSQAQARLPIFPEVTNIDGRIVITSPGVGTVRLPGGVNFIHRGIFQVTTAQTDFVTVANKTYHLRWNPTDGFQLKDLADVAYNSTSAVETSTIFDSVYDSMLVARITTNSSNVASITNLANKNVLRATGEEMGAKGALGDFASENNTAPSAIAQYRAVNINFARSPDVYFTAVNDLQIGSPAPFPNEFNVGAKPLSRYQVAVWGQGDIDIWTGWAARA